MVSIKAELDGVSREDPAGVHRLPNRVALLDRILAANPGVRTEFLTGFSDEALAEYAEHLEVSDDRYLVGRRRSVPAIVVRASRF